MNTSWSGTSDAGRSGQSLVLTLWRVVGGPPSSSHLPGCLLQLGRPFLHAQRGLFLVSYLEPDLPLFLITDGILRVNELYFFKAYLLFLITDGILRVSELYFIKFLFFFLFFPPI